MKVVAFNGSPNKDGNTSQLLKMVLSQLEEEGIETELIWLGNKPMQGCIACYKCVENKDKHCALNNDPINGYIDKMLEADGIILGSPTYVSDLSSTLKALIDRAGLVAKVNVDMLKYKVGAAVSAVRRCGAAHVFSSINYFFLINQMIVPGSSYWNMGIGRSPGDVQNDQEGIDTMTDLGKNMAWLLKKIKT
ncbi:MAG: flavodoxin family protein [Gammaproteobacteria bacterium]|nr:flavodoxin family protein [Gammaproteobacteria bacterium]